MTLRASPANPRTSRECRSSGSLTACLPRIPPSTHKDDPFQIQPWLDLRIPGEPINMNSQAPPAERLIQQVWAGAGNLYFSEQAESTSSLLLAVQFRTIFLLSQQRKLGDSSEERREAKHTGPRAARLAGGWGAGDARSPWPACLPGVRVQASRAVGPCGLRRGEGKRRHTREQRAPSLHPITATWAACGAARSISLLSFPISWL